MDDKEDTETKLALIASAIESELSYESLLELLVEADGNVEQAIKVVQNHCKQRTRCSLKWHVNKVESVASHSRQKAHRQKAHKVLHLYPSQTKLIEHLCPCTLILNVLPGELANELLKSMLAESIHWPRNRFRLFNAEVESPHSACFYTESHDQEKLPSYLYNGRKIENARQFVPEMIQARPYVEEAVRTSMSKRPNHILLENSELWRINVAFANLYKNGQEHVGWHSDQLTYLGPMPTIGSLSLGVEREFRIKRIDPAHPNGCDTMSIHLPHNSLLIMHAGMQESYKHTLHPAMKSGVQPNSISGLARINITYRFYPSAYGPESVPLCLCGRPCVLRCVQRKENNHGRYFWMCHTMYDSSQTCGCSFFKFEDFGYYWNSGVYSHTAPAIDP